MEIRRRTHEASADFAGHLHPVLRRVYAARGIANDSELDLSLEHLLPVGSLEGLDAATRLLGSHRGSGRVLVIGDFDADGATSTALLVEVSDANVPCPSVPARTSLSAGTHAGGVKTTSTRASMPAESSKWVPSRRPTRTSGAT